MKKINLMTVAVLSFSVLTLASCQKESATTPASTSTTATSASSQTAKSSTTETAASEVVSNEMSLAEAIAIYQAEFPDSDITSLEYVEFAQNQFAYTIEGMDDQKEYGIRIDVATGEVNTLPEENLDADEVNGVERAAEKLDLTQLLTIAEVAKIAEEAAGGGHAVTFDLEQELGTTYWEVTVGEGRNSKQVKLHAQTGEILEVELDD
ncbi:putative membrane protein YkoI [Enterococcus sp. PF1-24]|uniref:PepSY domain-containing protein n=1 Tax=unclassified Enterococcus TaxID=2608891 RepID=UPI002474D3D4|nr:MULTISPECIES: PepSY domain-containing protein [unclassified Enterococcus]MDH6365521.1 putative membrane protein YkoI [Enterococcus sp. PFB1-1]MDH6402622.1 putative membrane protein YkoI [Enterococcus sp. PF1-24]